MHILFVADPIEHFKIYKDTTFSMMREAQRRGHGISVCEPRHLRWQRGQPVTARVREISLTGGGIVRLLTLLLRLWTRQSQHCPARLGIFAIGQA